MMIHVSHRSCRVEAVKGCRGVGKKDMKLNDKLPKMTVDPETYEVCTMGKHAKMMGEKTQPRRECLLVSVSEHRQKVARAMYLVNCFNYLYLYNTREGLVLFLQLFSARPHSCCLACQTFQHFAAAVHVYTVL